MRHSFGVVTVAALALATAGLAVPATAAPAHTGLGIRLVDAPANLVKDPRARSYIIDHVGPGSHLLRHVEVTNDTGAPQHVSLYADAAAITNGGFTPLAGRSLNELTRWMTVTPATVNLQQGQRATAAVTIDVPNDASRGERYAAVFAEIGGRSVNKGFTIASRAGVRVYLDVGKGAAAPSDFKIMSLTAGRSKDGSPTIDSAVKNTGGRALDMVGQLWLRKGPGGLSAGPFRVEVGTTLGVGQTAPVHVLLDKALPTGPWLAHLELQSDLIKHAAEATVTFPSGNGVTAAPVRANPVPLTRNRHVLIPLALGLIGLLVLALVLFLLWRRRRREEEDEEQPRDGGTPRIPGQRAVNDERVRR